MAIAMAVAVGAMGRRWATYLLLPLLLIWMYALVSGLPPSVLRAAVMGTVYIIALAVGRPRSVLPALALSAAAMVAFEPKALLQLSFQLSFAAMAGIALGSPYFGLLSPAMARCSSASPRWTRPWLGSILDWTGVVLIVSTSATLATWPLVAFTFDRLPVLGIIVTVLALPALPLILVGTAATAVAGFLHPAISHFFGWLVWTPLSYLVELVAGFPSPTVSGAWVGSPLVWTWYLGLGALLILAKSRFRLSRLFPWLAPSPADPDVLRSASGRPTGLAVALVILAPALVAAAVLLWITASQQSRWQAPRVFFRRGPGRQRLDCDTQGPAGPG